MDKILSKIYYDVSQGFKGVDALFSEAKKIKPSIKRSDVTKFLKNQPTYTMHKSIRKKYKRNKVLVSCIDEQWQADLNDMTSLKEFNKGYKYLLTCIDLFSKYSWAVPLKSKHAKEIIDALKEIFKSGRKPYKLQTDAGTEFVNQNFKKFLKENEIDFFTTNSELKASVVERLNRTLKERMWKYFTYKNTFNYVDILSDFMTNYNNSYHRTIKMTPNQVNLENEAEIRTKTFSLSNENVKYKFDIGNKVRLSKVKRHFEKGYTPNWTEEFFIITERFPREPPVYKLKDQTNEPVQGVFYETELQNINVKSDDIYVIEKILKTRKRNNKLDYYVKWRGYPDKFNSYVSDLIKI